MRGSACSACDCRMRVYLVARSLRRSCAWVCAGRFLGMGPHTFGQGAARSLISVGNSPNGGRELFRRDRFQEERIDSERERPLFVGAVAEAGAKDEAKGRIDPFH